MIDTHIQFLLNNDPVFLEYWSGKSQAEQGSSIDFATEIDGVTTTPEGLDSRTLTAADRSRRFLSCVPQKDMDYSRRPIDWPEFVGDEASKKRQYQLSYDILLHFLAESKQAKHGRLYGSIKSIESLDDKFGEDKAGSAARKFFRDTWDVIRFRIVCVDLDSVRSLAVEVWQYFYSEVVKCRNYYMYPITSLQLDPYGAVHFEIEITEGRWIELQILTEARDLAGFLDYALVHKKLLTFIDDEHENWLRNFRRRVLVWDSNQIPSEQLRTPK